MSIVGGPVRVPVSLDLSQYAPEAERARKALGGLGTSADQTRTSTAGLTQAQGQLSIALRQNTADLQRAYALLNNDPTDASRARVERLTGALIQQRTALRQQETAFRGVQRGGTGANQMLLDFGRLTNDSIQFQYGLTQGLVATANQIDGLVLGFQRMGAQAKASGTTMRAELLGALKGPGGLILLLNLAATAAVLFGDKIVAAFNDAGESASRSTKQIEAAIDRLIRFERAERGLTIGSAAEGQAKLNELLREEARLRGVIAQRVRGQAGAPEPSNRPGVIQTPRILDAEAFRRQLAAEASGAVADATAGGAGQFTVQLNIEADAARERLGFVQAGIAKIRAELSQIALEGDISDALNLPPAGAFDPVVRSARETRRAVVSDFDALAADVETAADKIRDALASDSREREGLISAGQITRLQAARDESESLARALRTVFRLPEGTEGRATLIGTIQDDLQGARREALALGVALGQIDVSALPVALFGARDAQVDLRREADAALRTYEATAPAVDRVSASMRFALEYQEELRQGAQAFVSALSGGILSLGSLALFGDGGFGRDFRLAELDADEQIARLSEQFREGEISAERLALETEAIRDNLAALGAEAPTIGNILKNVFRDVGAEIAAIIARTIALRAVLAGLNVIGLGGFGSFLGLSGSSGGLSGGLFGGVLKDGGASSPVVLRDRAPIASPALSGGGVSLSDLSRAVAANLSVRQSGPATMGGTAIAIPYNVVFAGAEAGREAVRRSGGAAV